MEGSPCILENGQYFAALPEVVEGAPMALYLHGYAGSGGSVIKNTGLTKRFTGRGYALIAPDGQMDPVGAFRRDWAVDDGYELPRDDIAFIGHVIDDAAQRFGLDRGRVLVTGFSRGGSMVWDLACATPRVASAFASASGGFWEPMQTGCAGPATLYHTHGFSDRVVPLEGRAAVFNGVAFHQGNILTGLDTFRREGGCMGAAEAASTEGELWIKTWSDCTAGSLTLELHPGGHGLPKGWVTRVLNWFETTAQNG
ncbi:alpha/beta hydrolase family esterase [Oceanibium sediminis]|uniref:alpha/beta hydrolase family esterase n=1 Tax=Oceanibium sediminis TaxID=2026339 RepID=UPI001E3368E8|nr:polyhydroxybutyrate depolymerase [Oceanibium sediminis]